MGADRDAWDAKADEWASWVGDEGDATRRYISDPVLWRLAGDVRGKRVLDAGCGTGYLTIKLAARGAKVVGIDSSPRMIEVARRRAAAKGLRLDFRVDSCASLESIPDGSIDLLILNFVLMDVADLDGALRASARVLAMRGRAVIVLVHPCFQPPLDGAYSREQRLLDSWGPFATPFVHYHRPLARYLSGFLSAGLLLEAMEEPVVSEPPAEMDEERARRWGIRPFVLAFALKKAAP